MFSSISGEDPAAAASTAAAAVSTATSTPSNGLTNLGLGFPVAIALGSLVVLALLLLASYICYRSRLNPPNPNPNPNPNSSAGVELSRVIFVAEDDDGDGAALGLDEKIISSYPKFPYAGSGESLCTICLCEYREGEMLRMLPDCRHCFHLFCVDAWLRLNASCPVCRNSPMPTPLSTPLSELVPLAQFAADRRRRRL